MAKANQTTTTTNNSDQTGYLALLMAARNDAAQKGMDTKGFDALIQETAGPIRDQLGAEVCSLMEAGIRAAGIEKAMDSNLVLMDGQKFAAVLTFADGTFTVAVEKIVKKNGKGAKRSKAVSTTAGNVLIVGKEAFKSYAVLCDVRGISKAGANQRLTYESASKKNPEAYPAAQVVSYEDFFPNHAELAPAGYWDKVDGTAQIVKEPAM